MAPSHFRTFSSKSFDYHGVFDLILMPTPTFASVKQTFGLVQNEIILSMIIKILIREYSQIRSWWNRSKQRWKVHHYCCHLQQLMISELDTLSFHLILYKSFDYHGKSDLIVMPPPSFASPRKSRTWYQHQITFSMIIKVLIRECNQIKIW